MKFKHKELVELFKDDFYFSTDGFELDFRKHVYVNNEYGLYPQKMSWSTAVQIIDSLYAWAHDVISSHSENFPDFSGWIYNTEMEVNKLKTCKIKDKIDDVINTLIIHSK